MTSFLEDIDEMLVRNRVLCDELNKRIEESTDLERLKVLATTATMMLELTSEVLANAAEVIRRHREKD